ncbi:hypothetical protein SRHO_G00062950 [Serrasalmus rhombeus]
MYQYSLQSFSAVFHRAIERAPLHEDVAARVHSLTEAVTYSVFQYTSRGLFQRDRLTFLTHAAFQILLMDGPGEPSGPCQFWRRSGGWTAMWRAQLSAGGSCWRSECPERQRLPLDWKKKSPMQKLIILRAMRPDRDELRSQVSP